MKDYNVQDVINEEINIQDLNFEQLKELEEIVTPGSGTAGCC